MLADQRVTVMIPALDEGDCIADVVGSLPRDLVDEVIVVDNGSGDDTAGIAEAAGATVLFEPTRGYGHALMRAIRTHGREGIVVFMDGDGADDPADLPALLAPFDDGVDLVLGQRVAERAQAGAKTLPQWLGTHLVTGLVDLLYGHRFQDLGPFRAIRADALHRLAMCHLTYGWTVEMQIKALSRGLEIVEVPVRHRRRIAGVSKVSGTLRGVMMAGLVMPTTVLRIAWRERGRGSGFRR
jgi:glycosyltransferase involved in cell wall biosynthesis